MGNLRKLDLHKDPLEQFSIWLDYVEAAGTDLPVAMALATVDASGLPRARIVLLRGLTRTGFVFYTNETSQKGKDLQAMPSAALVFHWPALERQVRVRGEVKKINPAESDTYFQSRPRGSQLGAWASPQSQIIPERSFLEKGYHEVEMVYAGQTVPRPPHWGGFEVTPFEVEFWQGQPDRLHDRLRYQRSAGGLWEIVRLAP